MSDATTASGHCDPTPAHASEAAAAMVSTRVYAGQVGHVVLTVQGDTPAATRMLSRACGAAIEAAVLRTFQQRLTAY